MQEIALERISFLFGQAQLVFSANPPLAHRYIHIARRLAMATRLHIPPGLKRYVCHGCKHFLVPGANMRVRTHHRKHYGSYVAVTCLDCGHITRYLFRGPACRLEQHEPLTEEK
jgi:RNase P subunit RPR2